MTDLVARLREAIDAEEARLHALPPFPWKLNPDDDTEVFAADDVVLAEAWALSSNQQRLVAQHILAGSPERGLRRCAADRKILDAWDANERELGANSAEFSRPARPMEDEAERFRRLGNAKAQGWELQGRRWALRLALTGLAEAYGVEA